MTDAGGAEDAGTMTSDAGVEALPHFSFFVTSLEAMLALSGSEDGFGGDLRFGQATGLAGADAICTAIAEGELPGSGRKVWRAFLSASTDGQGGGQVNAIDRIGSGPWYDRNGRLVAQDLQGLMGTRPDGDPVISSDLPNERGESQKNQPGPGAQSLFQLAGKDGMAVRRVGADHDHHVGMLDAIEILRARRGTEGLAQAIAGGRMAHPRAGIDIVRSEPGAQQLLHEEGFLIGAAAGGDTAKRPRPVLRLDRVELARRETGHTQQ